MHLHGFHVDSMHHGFDASSIHDLQQLRCEWYLSMSYNLSSVPDWLTRDS